MPQTPRILWADDEIDLLQPHVMFLESKGYDVVKVTNGSDAIEEVKQNRFEVVLLDEQMPGMDGLATLVAIHDIRPDIPVVMITKSEEERIMEEALGQRISDYLTKPVNPSQVLLTCKRILDRVKIRNEQLSQEYLRSFGSITSALMNPLSVEEWIELYRKLVGYDLELEGDENVRQILDDQYREANRVFGRFVEDKYASWIKSQREGSGDGQPMLSNDVVERFVAPLLDANTPVVFFVIDCMRYDQWLMFESMLQTYFDIETDFHFSLLPTATPYSRNAIFSGLLPSELADQYSRYWNDGEDDEHSRNRNEEELLNDQLSRLRKNVKVRYDKIISASDSKEFVATQDHLLQNDLSAVVVNFVDILAHSRSDSAVLKELAPDERAYRALTKTWFEHSWLYQVLQDLSTKKCTIVVTTDHGAVRSLHAAKVIGDRNTSTALRYKYGRNLKSDSKHSIFVQNPLKFGLPTGLPGTNYIIAKEDYYFVYPTNYNQYLNRYRDTMQHGGASMEEMILPVITMKPK